MLNKQLELEGPRDPYFPLGLAPAPCFSTPGLQVIYLETNYRALPYSAPSIPVLSKGGRKPWLSSGSREELPALYNGDDAQTRELSGTETQEASNLDVQPKGSSHKGTRSTGV